jgi:hypothetical protein
METYEQALQNVVDAILGRGGASGSLPQHRNAMFHVEHSPNSRQDSPLPAPVGYGVDMNGDDVPRGTSYPQPVDNPVDKMFHVEHSQDSPLSPALGYSAVINQKENQMTVNEALNALVEAITEKVVDAVTSELETMIEDKISEHQSDYDHDEFAQRDDIRDIVEDLLSGASITL